MGEGDKTCFYIHPLQILKRYSYMYKCRFRGCRCGWGEGWDRNGDKKKPILIPCYL